MFFTDPQMEAEQESFQYFFQLVLSPESPCSANIAIVEGVPWQLRWDHPGCEYLPEDHLNVLIRRAGYEDLLLEVPAVGPYVGP